VCAPCVRVCGADAAGFRLLQKCGPETLSFNINVMDIFNHFEVTASQCGLPANTVKLSRPYRNPCSSAADNLTSIFRYRAPVCMCMSAFVSACVCVCVMRMYAHAKMHWWHFRHQCLICASMCACTALARVCACGCFCQGRSCFKLFSSLTRDSHRACPNPKTPASCGLGTACQAAISSFDDTMLSVVMTGLKV
jgi:hypothetical protein